LPTTSFSAFPPFTLDDPRHFNFNMSAQNDDELIDYYEDDVAANGAPAAAGGNGVAVAGATDGEGDKDKKNFSGIHSTGFRYLNNDMSWKFDAEKRVCVCLQGFPVEA
jgi:hypothetical protein